VDRIILEDDDGVEEANAAGHVAPRGEARKRNLLVTPRLGLRRLQRLQPLADARAVVDADAHRQRADEDAGHRLGAREIRRPPSDRRAEADIALAAEARKKERPRALNDRIQGDAMPPRKLYEAPRVVLVELDRARGRVARDMRGCRSIERQRRR